MIKPKFNQDELKNSIALRKFGVWAMLVFCLLLTILALILVGRANSTYHSAVATVMSVSGPDVNGKASNKRYVYTYYVDFTDKSGNPRYGQFSKPNSENAWEYARGDAVTIYHADDFADEDKVYITHPSESALAFLLFVIPMWVIEIILVVMYVLHAKKYDRLYGNSKK